MTSERYLYVHREQLREWQIETLKVQQEVQTVFDECSLNGWCGGGTLIGAFRNKGFLYWDNDLDMFFEHKDYKKILLAFREKGIFKKYDLFDYFRGCWQKSYELMNILCQEELDENLLDYELKYYSRSMFKVFARDGVAIRFYDDDRGEPEKYVKIKHFSRVHVTRYREANRNDYLDLSCDFRALPNVCMLPMAQMKYWQYLTSCMLFLAQRASVLLGGKVSLGIDRIIGANKYVYKINNKSSALQPVEYDRAPFDSFSAKLGCIFKNLITTPIYWIKDRMAGKRGSYISYRPDFFRFQVRPFFCGDIFPLRKMKFENVEINVPKNLENILEIQFGDFSQVPPIEKRVAYPFFLEGRL